MTKLPKILLAICATAFVTGLAVTAGNFDLPPAWGVAMPLSAIFFGAFLVTRMLQDEMAKFDEERRAQVARVHRQSATVEVKRPALAPVSPRQTGRGLAAAH